MVSNMDSAEKAARRYEKALQAVSAKAAAAAPQHDTDVPYAWIRLNRKRYPRLPSIALPDAETNAVSLANALSARKSVRTFGGPLTLQDLANVLGEAARARRDDSWSRPYPSAGARNAVEWYALTAAGGMKDLPGGTYHYDPDQHALDVLNDADPGGLLKGLIANQPISVPPVLIVLTILLHRTCVKYGGRGLRFAYLEAGAAAMAANLSGQTHGLVCCWLGGFDDRLLASALDVSLDLHLEVPVLGLTLGRPA